MALLQMSAFVVVIFAASAVQCFGARPVDSGIAMFTDKISLPNDFVLLGSGPHLEHFKAFVSQYDRRYESVTELQQRYAAYQVSMGMIEAHNSKEARTYSLGVNKFADWTWEEFKGKMLGASQNCSATKGNHVMSNKLKPTKKDWRADGIVTPVKDQGVCGSCWTFSTTGALEAAWTQKTGESVSLSEQQLVDCAGEYNNYGCMGGLPSQAYQYIIANGGLETEESYPYQGVDGQCQFGKSSVGATVKAGINITEFNEEELLDALAFVRPVSIAYEVAPDFALYLNGVYSSSICRSGAQTVNHAVLAVGYNTEGLAGVPYYIVKNSWGTAWGENGYFNIEMFKNMCGIATCSSYPEV